MRSTRPTHGFGRSVSPHWSRLPTPAWSCWR